ncbi:MAG: glycosyltransferase family 1 protein, partial [Candidatus Spechtbacterales bacterium]
MKIGIDCHNLEGQRTGVGRYLWNLLNEWAKSTEAEFFLYFKNEIPEDIKSLVQVDKGFEYTHDRENIQIPKWNFRLLNGKSNAIFKHWLLPRAAAKDKVDVLFCPDYVLPFYAGNRTKTAVTIHDIIYEACPREYSWPSWKDKILLKWVSKQSAKKADVIFVPSEFTKSEILKYYKVNSKKVVVTLLAPDPIFQSYTHDRERMVIEEMRKKYGVQDNYVLFVGSIFNRRFLPQKIQAFSEFGKNHPDFQFLIVGENHTKPLQDIGACVARVNKESGRAAVILKNYVSDEDLVYLYNGAFATLWLSSYEGFGLPVLESMACGTPVITSMKGSLPEIAGDAARYVAHPENPEEISNALVHLIRYDSYRD